MSEDNDKKEETRLGKLYEVAISEEKFILPKSISKNELLEYTQDMIARAQPRHLRKEGRPLGVNIYNYKIPVNYFVIDSNTVSYNASLGTINVRELSDVSDDDDDENNKLVTSVPNYFRDDDIGLQICLYIFKNGRKSIDELISELSGLDKHMLTLLINKMINDGYLKRYPEVGQDNLETLELVEADKEEEEEEEEEGKEIENT